MRLPDFLRRYLLGYAQGVMASRPPDVQIGNDYVHRWMLLPKRNRLSKFFNVYIHLFMQDDEDGALHDHEPDNCSLILSGSYIEQFHAKPLEIAEGRYAVREVVRRQGDIVFRMAQTPHRICLFTAHGTNGDVLLLKEGRLPVITMFVQGPRRRRWGFHCVQGWKPWQDYIDQTNGYGDRSGKGCG